MEATLITSDTPSSHVQCGCCKNVVDSNGFIHHLCYNILFGYFKTRHQIIFDLHIRECKLSWLTYFSLEWYATGVRILIK